MTIGSSIKKRQRRRRNLRCYNGGEDEKNTGQKARSGINPDGPYNKGEANLKDEGRDGYKDEAGGGARLHPILEIIESIFKLSFLVLDTYS
jgi:hypothetical protein